MGLHFTSDLGKVYYFRTRTIGEVPGILPIN